MIRLPAFRGPLLAALVLVAGMIAAVAAGFDNSVAPDDWAAYRDRFVMPDGRVVDDANGGISHSEGQGYGLLLAFPPTTRDVRAHFRSHPNQFHPRRRARRLEAGPKATPISSTSTRQRRHILIAYALGPAGAPGGAAVHRGSDQV
jgi:endoglucanase